MRHADKHTRALLGLGFLALVGGCLLPPVRESVRLEIRAEGSALITTEIRIADEKDFDHRARVQRRIERTRRDAADEQDGWSKRLSRLELAWDERSVERHEGRIVRVTRKSLLSDAAQLEALFADTDVDCELREGRGWYELSFVPGVSRRASGNQREVYEPLEASWIISGSRYLGAMSALYAYLEERPARAELCLAPLVNDLMDEASLPDLTELDEREARLVEEAHSAAEDLQRVFAVPKDEAYTIDELSSLVHDPFPAPLDLRVPGEIMLVEGFREEEGELRIRGPSLWNAWRAIGDEHLSPDPVRERWERARSEGEEKLSLPEFASRPRHARDLDTDELGERIRELLEPPAILRVRWRAEQQPEE